MEERAHVGLIDINLNGACNHCELSIKTEKVQPCLISKRIEFDGFKIEIVQLFPDTKILKIDLLISEQPAYVLLFSPKVGIV